MILVSTTNPPPRTPPLWLGKPSPLGSWGLRAQRLLGSLRSYPSIARWQAHPVPDGSHDQDGYASRLHNAVYRRRQPSSHTLFEGTKGRRRIPYQKPASREAYSATLIAANVRRLCRKTQRLCWQEVSLRLLEIDHFAVANPRATQGLSFRVSGVEV